MRKNGNIITATAEEIANLPDLSDWEAASRLTEENIEAAIASDPDEAGWDFDLSSAQPGTPGAAAAQAEPPRWTVLGTAFSSLPFVPALLTRLFRHSGKR